MRLRHSIWKSASSASWKKTFPSRPSIYLIATKLTLVCL